ncbi:MAG: hypothetical protein ACRENJ_01685 [Candidatus Eiseniibacteriota bacterium]
MSIAMGAWLAAAAGLVTGPIAAHIRRPSPARGSVIAWALLGALLGAATYAAFLAAGFVVSLLTFGSPVDPVPALLCVLVGCPAFLVLTWLQSVLERHRRRGEPRGAPRRCDFRVLLESRPAARPTTMWLAGVGVASLPALYGLQCLWTRTGSLGTLIWPSAVEGGAAIALGLGWIGVGVFLHLHYCLSLYPSLEPHRRTAKLLALIAACAGLSIAGAWSVAPIAMATR